MKEKEIANEIRNKQIANDIANQIYSDLREILPVIVAMYLQSLDKQVEHKKTRIKRKHHN
jgi:hypothetical protein